MRTLKKTLCLVLVLAMMVGLCAMGASAADYTDQNKITATEAVDLLTALGVFEGYPGGAFDPDKALTRAEGAKIIALMLGANVTGLKSSFSDMGGHWADGFVAYCASIGIIAGYGDGRFGPDDPLTYAQFAKMLLCALGYDATRELLTGAEWEIGVAKLVNQVNLSKQVSDFNYSATINRNDTAQMAFNTLLTPMVGYNGNGIAVAGGNLATPREYLANASYDYRADFGGGDNDRVWNGTQWVAVQPDNQTDGLMEFIENYFPNTKLVRDTDDYGLNTHKWFKGRDRSDKTYNESKQIASAPSDVIMATYTTDVALVSLDTLWKDAKWTKAVADELEELKVVENGHLYGERETYWYDEIIPTKGSTTPGALGWLAGATVLLIDTEGFDGVGDTLIVKYPLLAKVTDVISAEDSRTKERQIELEVFNGYADSAITTFETETFSKNEYVLVYPDMTIGEAIYEIEEEEFAGIIEVTPVDSTIGTLSKVGYNTVAAPGLINGAVNALTVDGVRYSVGSYNFAGMGPEEVPVYAQNASYNLNAEITLYTANGYVLGVNAKPVPYTDYVFVVGISNSATQDLITGNWNWTVAYAKQDGTTETTLVTTSSESTPPAIGHKWCTVTPRGNTSTFRVATAPAATSPNGTEIHGLFPDTPALNGSITTNGKTNFVILSGSTATTVKAYTGIANVPTFGSRAPGGNIPQGTAYPLLDRYGNTAAVFIDFGTNDSAATTGAALYFTSAVPNGTVKDGASTYYTFDVINTKGELSTVNVAASAITHATDAALTDFETNGAGLYIPETDAKGNITKLTAPTVAGGYLYETGLTGTIAAGDGVLTVEVPEEVDSNPVGVAANAVIYRYSGGQVKQIALEDMNKKTGDVAVITANPMTTSVATIFFVPHALLPY